MGGLARTSGQTQAPGLLAMLFRNFGFRRPAATAPAPIGASRPTAIHVVSDYNDGNTVKSLEQSSPNSYNFRNAAGQVVGTIYLSGSAQKFLSVQLFKDPTTSSFRANKRTGKDGGLRLDELIEHLTKNHNFAIPEVILRRLQEFV